MEDKMELGVTVIWDSDEIVKIIEQGEEDIYFFFQAEVGIRDKLVTGVQTCALPISAALPDFAPRSPWPRPGASSSSPRPIRAKATPATRRAASRRRSAPMILPSSMRRTRLPRARSEERRVGKECRIRWMTYHLREVA